jgi:epoxyqueuosine reductase
MTKQEIRELAKELGIDLVGFTTCDRLDARLRDSLRPYEISRYLPTFMVLAKHIASGIGAAADGQTKQFASALVHRVLEEAAAELAYHLEEQDYLAVALPSLIMDFKSRNELSNTPAGQGSLYLRLAAVEAGLGTLGLNTMLLTPRFGPRVYLCGMMTNLKIDPDEPLGEELCVGLEACGRCAAVCPADAIPRRAPRGAPLGEYRGLDGKACARRSQPHGVGAFIDHFKMLLKESKPAETLRKIDTADTSLLWYNLTVLRQGAFTGCSKCLQVCPVGDDYETVQASPHRRQDLPADLGAEVSGETVTISHRGGELSS